MIHTGDCIEVMAGMPADSVDAVVTDPPYGLEFMGRSWDRLGDVGTTSHSGPAAIAGGERGQYGKVSYSGSANKKCRTCGKWAWDHEGRKCECEVPDFPNVGAHQGKLMQDWHYNWAVEALRVTKPGGYLLAFGGTRTHHRLVCGLEDAGWIIRDELDWIYASGFPKGKANLKPAHEPIVLARKPGPLRPLNIEETRIPSDETVGASGRWGFSEDKGWNPNSVASETTERFEHTNGRWPSNVLLSDPELFDEPNPYVVGSGATATSGSRTGEYDGSGAWSGPFGPVSRDIEGDAGGYSRFFIVPKSARADREPIVRGQLEGQIKASYSGGVSGTSPRDDNFRSKDARENLHPTVKPTDLMRHLIRLVTPSGGTVLDPFAGSGSTLIAAEMEGFAWIGIEQDASYVAIAEARLNGTQRGLGLDVPAPTRKQPKSTGMGKPGASAPTYKGDFRNSRRRLDGEEPAA